MQKKNGRQTTMQIFRGITLTYAKAKLIKKKKNIFRGILEKKIEGLLCNNVGIVLMRGGTNFM